jgi:glutamate 5-kinase
MSSKVQAAGIAASAGIPTLVAATADATEALGAASVGTVFHPTGTRTSTRLLWLAHATTPTGSLVLDAGAVEAVVERRLSLLPAGITGVNGTFLAGDPVDLVDENGDTVARGLVNFDASELPSLVGRSTRDLALERGPEYEREVVHRDDLVVIRGLG